MFQVKNEYLNAKHPSLDQEVAIQLCCFEIRYDIYSREILCKVIMYNVFRTFCKDMAYAALDKKSNLDYLEKEIGFHKFLPKTILEGIKPKILRKSIQQHFKKVRDFYSRCLCLL